MIVIGWALGLLFTFDFLWIIPQFSSFTATFWIAGWKVEVFYGVLITLIPCWIVSFLRRRVVIRVNFNVVYRMKQIGQRIVLLFFVFLVMYIAVSLIYPAPGMASSAALIFLVILNCFLAGAVVNYYGDVLNSDKLAALCFLQAIESKGSVSKGEWIRNALRHLREYASQSHVEIDTSRFQRLFAIRLLQGENVDSDLKNVSVSLLKHISPITALNNIKNSQQDFSFITTGKTRRERLDNYFEKANRYASLLGAIGTILVTLITFLMLR